MLQVLTAAAFLLAGYAALSGQPAIVETFDRPGIGQRFRYVTGTVEVVSAILLRIPRLTPVGAALLVCAMAGAFLNHLLLIGGPPVPESRPSPAASRHRAQRTAERPDGRERQIPQPLKVHALP